MSYLNGIQSAKGLGKLNPYMQARLAAQQETLQRLLDENPSMDGLVNILDILMFLELF